MEKKNITSTSGKGFRIKDLPKKPQKGPNWNKNGFETRIVTNHFKIEYDKHFKNLAIYAITILHSESNEPLQADNRKVRDSILRELSGKIKPKINKYYQSGWNIWAFADNPKPMLTFEVVYNKVPYNVRFLLTDQSSLNDILDKEELNLQFRQVLNVIAKNQLKSLNYIEIGKNAKFFKLDEYDQNPVRNSQLKVWTGFTTSVHVFQRVPYLLIDYSTRVLREETALQRIQDFMGNKADLLAFMKEQSVMASYGNHKIYRVHDIDFKRNPLSSFSCKNQKMTYVDYFLKQYNLKIKSLNQPLIIHNSKKLGEICLVPELMKMTGLKDEERSNGQLMKNLSLYTKKDPTERMERITQLFRDLVPKFQRENLGLDSNNTCVATQLNPPELKMKKVLKASKGFFALKDCLLNPMQLKDWIFMYSGRGQRDNDAADSFVSDLMKAAGTFAIQVKEPLFLVMDNFNMIDWEKELRKEIGENGKPQIVLTWIPDNQRSKYKQLKEIFFQKLGVNHQNVVSTCYLKCKNRLSKASKILLQINSKIGLPIWKVQQVNGLPKRVMLVGVDVYHKTIKNRQSCAGFVATLDENFTKHYSAPVIQSVGQELMTQIAVQMVIALKCYLNENNYLPEYIIFYRDGVGESQIKDVIQVEIEAIKKSFAILSEDYNPGFIEILVTKRISHRMFSPVSINNGAKMHFDNPPSGTLITEKITNEYFEFYLVPQEVTQGTATPTHFSVIQNNTNLTQDVLTQIQEQSQLFSQLTYFQCFNYSNWTGAVRVPAVVQLAHKLAYLVGETFQNQLSNNLNKTLCYL